MFRIVLGAVAALALAPAANATVLTFDVTGGVSNFENVDQAYGDNVAAAVNAAGSYGVGAEGFTPNVVVGYGTPGEDPALWTTGYGDLTNILFNDADNDTTFTVRFTAAAGFLVDLYGFDMASFLTGGQTIQGLTVRDVGANNILYSQGSTFVTGATHNAVSFGMGPLSANELELVINLTGLGSVSDDIGIDNVRFGQHAAPVVGGIPEPSTWAMMVLGLGAAGALVRRRRAALA